MGMGAHLLLTSTLPLSLPSISSPSFPFHSLLSPRRTKIHEEAVGLHVACCSSRPPNSNVDDSSWDSNAETWTTAGRFRFRINRDKAEEAGSDGGFSGERRGWSWWSGDGADQLDQDEEEEEEEEEDELFEQDPWDSFWIFKVFKSFGWLLPPIIISMLVATGPKAFLMALALPFGQSALSFAADKLWGKPQTNQRNRATKAKKKKKKKDKPFAQRTSSTRTQMGEEEEEEEDVRRDSFGRPAYQSWAAAGGEDGKAGEGGGRPEPSFGGWDELENGRRAAGRRKRSSARRGVGGKGGTTVGKLSRRGWRKKEVPLFIRLLIAVFPFLGSWTNLL